MQKFVINGGNKLIGTIPISGSKNSALAILAASALGSGPSQIENVPDNTDVTTMCKILKELGVEVNRDIKSGIVVIDGTFLENLKPSYQNIRKMRASFYTAGILLSRLKEAEVPLPGGCPIGTRPVDYHLKAFRAFGAEVVIEHGYVKAYAEKLKGTRLFIERSSVGTTINVLMVACLADGATVIDNAAREPEIVDLANHLNAMGANIKGAGTETIEVTGVDSLHGADHEIIPDRIEVGTYIMAGAITGGEITLDGVLIEHIKMVLNVLQEAGIDLQNDNNLLYVKASDIFSVDVETSQYPGFPTDLQQPLGVLLSISEGISVLRETIFGSRFKYVDELRRMGAEIKIKQDMVIISGVDRLTGAPVEAQDLRGGAALVLAGLAALGRTEIYGIEHIDRGYENMAKKLKLVGADIQRCSESK